MKTSLQMEKELFRMWHRLPDERRQQVLDFMRSFEPDETQTPGKAVPLQSALGLCADLGVSLEADTTDRARQELWSQTLVQRFGIFWITPGFPRAQGTKLRG